MARKDRDRAGEEKIGMAVLRMAAEDPNGEVGLARLKREMPDYVPLTAADLKESETRPGEPVYHQIIRNIVSHKKVPGNLIAEGFLQHIGHGRYRVTDAGRLHLKHKGH